MSVVKAKKCTPCFPFLNVRWDIYTFYIKPWFRNLLLKCIMRDFLAWAKTDLNRAMKRNNMNTNQ